MAETLSQKTNIEFSRALGEEEIRELFTHLALGLSSEIKYTVKRHENVGNKYDKGLIYPILSSIEIGGAIYTGRYYIDKGCGMAPFNCFRYPENKNSNKLNGIEFFIAPGYEIEDVTEGEIELFDEARRIAHRFIEIISGRED